jgi:hypothetical protein
MKNKENLEEVGQTINYDGKEIEIIWKREVDFSKLKNVTQVYGIIFNKLGKILIVKIKKNKWSLPGGTPESEDKSFEETLRREVIEEADVEIENLIPLGYQRAVFADSSEKEQNQLRYVAKVKKILPQTIDPAYGVISKRKFIYPKNFLKYCPWGKVGRRIIEDALFIKNNYFSHRKGL